MAGMRTSSALELLVQLRRDDLDPLHRQLERVLRDAVRDGRLVPATVLPSTRALARQLGVSRGIVVQAYEQLVAEGYLASRPGGVTQVARTSGAPVTRAIEPAPIKLAFDLRPGRPDLDHFPRLVWLRSIRRVLNEAPSERFGYLDGRGTPELRQAIAGYLNRVRGTAATPADVVICSGFAQGLALVAQVLRATGGRRMALEDPSDPEYRTTVRAAGLEAVGVPVDGSGIRVDLLAGADVDAVLVTAAHQYPTGGVLPADRRMALIDWAEHRDGLIVEDDYDAEFRYDREPIGTIKGLCQDHVVYSGSASKTVAPGLRLGWLVAPPRFIDALAAAKAAADMGSGVLDQLAFADMVERGELDRHLRRMRPIYHRRRDRLLEALAQHLPTLRPAGVSAGLQLLAWLPADLDESRIVAAAHEAGIGVAGLTSRRFTPGPGGLILGYGGIDEGAIDDGVRALANVIAAVADEGTTGVR